jgi:CRISPR-associated protein Csx10
MHYTLKLTTESWLLTASGEGGALIDADVVFDKGGFPIIPARRVKGLLRESFCEVLEITGQNEVETAMELLFGKRGEKSNKGKLIFENLRVCEAAWEEGDDVEEYQNLEPMKSLSPDQVQNYFTAEIQQTAIDDKSGTAKKHSLRNYRVIKPRISFEGRIAINEYLTTDEEKNLHLAILQLRYAGTRRNRGFGKIKCELSKPIHEQVELSKAPFSKTNNNVLDISVKLLSPVVLADPVGEQNTVFTKKNISGGHIRGLLASDFIRRKNLIPEKAQQDSDFFEFFLSGRLRFGNLFFSDCQPIPLHLQYQKLIPGKPLVSVFNLSKNISSEEKITKPFGGFGSIKDSVITKKSPGTTFNFHNSRMDRAAGRSTEKDEDSGIFYYESLREGQEFKGQISGDAELLKKIYEAFPSKFEARMGRSRSAQYGSVEVSIEPGMHIRTEFNARPGEQDYILMLESPMVLLDTNGVACPGIKELETAFCEAFPGSSISVKQAYTSRSEEEQFNSVWMAKTEKIPAFAAGSSFIVSLSDKPTSTPDALGEWQERGYGRFRLEEYDKVPKNYTRGADDDAKAGENKYSSSFIQKIHRYYAREEALHKVKKAALEKLAPNNSWSGNLNNHLIGRLERLFKNALNETEIIKWMNDAKGKPALESIKKAGFVDKDDKFIFERTICGNNWKMQQAYWATYFRALRKRNKEHKR